MRQLQAGYVEIRGNGRISGRKTVSDVVPLNVQTARFKRDHSQSSYTQAQFLPGGGSLLHLTGKNSMRLRRRGVRLKYYSQDDPTVAELC